MTRRMIYTVAVLALVTLVGSVAYRKRRYRTLS